jgi:hypothetical protein
MTMLMKFLCPNGHQLSTSADRAGKPGQCPKCGVKFLVPEADDAEEADAANAHGAENSHGGANGSATKSKANRDATIEFLCPNGHRLSGPARLQGMPGQCPHCKTKFRIPSYDEEAADDVEEIEEIEEIDEIEELGEDEFDEAEEVQELAAVEPPAASGSDSRAASGSGTGSGLDFLASLEVGSSSTSPSGLRPRGSSIGKIGPITEPGSNVHDAEAPAGSSADGAAAQAGEPHPLADVFARFWKQRGKYGVVELHLNDGKVVTPKRFSRRLSQPQFGVFALDDSDGTHALVTIPWAAIAQLHLRGLKKLPDGIFD